MCRPVLLALLALNASLPSFASAQSAPAPQPIVRYHYGDNPAWSDPGYDDSSWKEAPNREWPLPPASSNGFAWVRIHLQLPTTAAGPLALRETSPQFAPPVEEIYFNGTLLGSNGDLPPHPRPWTAPPNQVFSIPDRLLYSSPNTSGTAVIAVRAWTSPALENSVTHASRFTIDAAPTQVALAREARYSLLLSQLPIDAIGLLLVLLGFGLLAIGIAIRRREMLLFAIVLITGPLQSVLYQLTDTHSVALPQSLFQPVMFLLLCAVPVFYVQFLWEALNLPGRGWKYAVQASSVASAFGFFVIAMAPGIHFPAWVEVASIAFSGVRDVLEAGAALWAIAKRPSGRLLAFAIFLTPAASFLSGFADLAGPPWPTIGDSLFHICVMLGGILIAAILVARAWKAWRNGERLRGELDAAREVQQRLVPSHLPHVPGCALAAAYLPATEVGGDLYQVLPLSDGATLIVIGDVSGKGLNAAMRGTLLLGALRSLSQEWRSPAQILTRLNAQLAATPDGGFITCLCARVDNDGTLALANAGHLAPYRNGEEVSLESGLPLGIAPDATYAESTIQLSADDRLTFLSDGVVEAQSPIGELFGFDRSRAISTQSAESIAQAAQQFGQEDDITVLTLTFAPKLESVTA